MQLDIFSTSPVIMDKPVVEIETGTTWFSVKCDPNGKLPCGLNIARFVQFNLVQKDYDPRLGIWRTLYNYTAYDKENNKALFPRYALNAFVTFLGEDYDIRITEVKPVMSRDIKISMKRGFELREHQKELFNFFISEGSYKPLSAQCGQGKACVHGTLVHTPHGKVPIETLKVGDEVVAWDGTVTKVTGVYPQGKRDIFAVVFPGGRHVEVDREHLWTVTTSKNATMPNTGARFLEDDTWQVYTTGEILEGMRSGIDYFIPAYLGCDKVTGADKLRIAGIMRSGEDAATCIAVDHPDELFVVEDDIVTHNTAVSIAASCYYGKVVLIVLGFLIDQWFKSIRQFTNVKRDDIYVIKGFEALKDLWEMIQNGFKPKIVICSTRTLSLYAVDRKEPYDSLPTYHELLEALGVGTIIMDEVHLNFYANTQIDLLSNVEHNIYLSATYLRSDPQGKKIFNLVFPKELVFGGSEVVKYTKVIIISYDLGIPDHAIARFKVIKGYLHAKYESFLLRNKRYFERFIDEILRRTIDQYFIPVRSSEQKLLILCQTKSFVLQVVESLKKLYPKLAPVPYFSGDSTYGKARMLEHKIIVSTIKSSSTGLDIKNLKVCINTVSFASEPQAAQCMGRLRRIPNEDTFFIDYYNREVSSQCWHIQNRKKAYRDRALSIDETSYN